LIADQLRATPEKSNRDIATGLGVDDKTVGVVRKGMEATAEIPQLEKTVGKDGKSRKKPERTHIPTQYVPEEADEEELLKTAKDIRKVNSKAKKKERTDRNEKLATETFELTGQQTYRVIYADPLWSYDAKVCADAVQADLEIPLWALSDLPHRGKNPPVRGFLNVGSRR
jgi:hypothetical protein